MNDLKEQQSAIFENLKHVALLAITDSSGLLSNASKTFCDLFGIEQTQLKGTDIHLLMQDGTESNTVIPAIKREVQFQSKSGFPFWLELSIFEIQQKNEKEFLWIGFDITERKSTERSLIESQLFSKVLMQNAPIGLLVANSVGQCTYVNDCWSRQSGMKGSQAKGRGWQTSIHPEDKARMETIWGKLVQEQCLFSKERFRYIQSEGREVWIDCSAVPIFDSKQSIVGYLCIEQDISEQLKSDKIIHEQHQAMVASSKMSALGEMAGGIAHEINTPLAAIRTLSSQIEEVMTDDPLDKGMVIEMASKIVQTSDRIAKIVRGLRSFSRDGSHDSYSSVNVKQLIEDTLSFCHERFKNGGTDLIVDTDTFDSKTCFEGRETEISQVLLNLLNNAHDAISEHKEKWIKVSVTENANDLEIRVTDCGLGITPENQKKIFQPFFTTKEIGKGTGMGLSISSGIIKGHQGELFLDNQAPNTCFVMRLPKKQRAIQELKVA
jgi:PAS domain S-box-containing protein